MDEADIAQQNHANINEDAMKEHERKMEGMDFIALDEGSECEECSRKLTFTTKARKDSGLCGECWDFLYRRGKNTQKFREGY